MITLITSDQTSPCIDGSSGPPFHVVIGFIWAWGVTWVVFKIAKNFMQIRVSPEVEIQGLDMPEFGVLAYPAFVLSHAGGGGHTVPPNGGATVPSASGVSTGKVPQ